jgi:hypothetical protein
MEAGEHLAGGVTVQLRGHDDDGGVDRQETDPEQARDDAGFDEQLIGVTGRSRRTCRVRRRWRLLG